MGNQSSVSLQPEDIGIYIINIYIWQDRELIFNDLHHVRIVSNLTLYLRLWLEI